MSGRLELENGGRNVMEVARTRLLVGGILFAAGFLIVAARLVDLSIFQHPDGPRDASGRTVVGELKTNRANIVDRNGVLLATSLVTASLYADPRRVPDPAAAARQLGPVLPNVGEAKLRQKLASDRSFVWIKRNLTPRQQFEVNRLGIPGLDFQREYRRIYPHGPLTAHVVGFTGIDNVGLGGVEQSFDRELRENVGRAVTLSLDVRIQQILREELARQIDRFGALGGGGIVMDANIGEIIAMVSLPDFDPNKPGEASADSRFNRASLGIYELGSVFKIFNHAVALESGTATLRDGYDATKPIRIARFLITDFHPEKRWLTLPEIFVHSSNIGSAKMALDIGGSTQRRFLDRLGLLQRTSVELPEQGQPLYPRKWRDINTMTIAYGHGIAVSPLHLVTAVAAVVNGGVRVRPTVVRRATGEALPDDRVLSPETSETMRRLLRLVVENGTGRNGAADGYLVGGKTGTAEKLENGRYKHKALISSFVGVFPITEPRYVVMAMLDEPKGIEESYGFATGGWTAAPVVSNVISRMAPLLGMAPVDEGASDIRAELAIR